VCSGLISHVEIVGGNLHPQQNMNAIPLLGQARLRVFACFWSEKKTKTEKRMI